MLRFSIDMGDCKPCDNTASAALINGWINSIFMLGPCASSVRNYSIFSEHVLDDFVKHLRLHRLLYKVPCSTLQCGNNVLLISDGGHHHDPRFGSFLHDLLSCLDPFHLRHGDVHEHDVWFQAVVLADGSQAIPRFAHNLSAE